MNWLTTLNKGEGSQLSNSSLVKCILETTMKKGCDYNAAHINVGLKTYFRLVTLVNECVKIVEGAFFKQQAKKPYWVI